MNTYIQDVLDKNRLRIEEQKKLFDYYQNDKRAILQHLDKALGITFHANDLEDLQRNYINIVTKTVDQLSIVYRNPAKRAIIKDAEKTEALKAELEKLTQYYESLLFAVNTADKTASRYAKLCNVSLTYVYFDKGKIKYKVLPTWLYDVVVSDEDPYKLEKVSYKTYFGDKEYRVVWTEDEYYKVESLKFGDIVSPGDKEPVNDSPYGIRNPYGIIPYAVLRLKEQGDFYGNGMTDLVNGNEQINVILTELMNEHILMGGAGTVLATNCGLATQKQDGSTSIKHVKVGRKHPIVRDNVQTTDVPPSIEYVSTQPLLQELRATVDWYIKMFALSKGLNPNSFLAEIQDTSGFSKVMDAFEQIELRKDDIEPCRIFEDERFEITRVINNFHASTTDKSLYKLEPIKSEYYLKVDFAEVETYLTPEQQDAKDKRDLELNLINVYDLKRRDNPDLTDEEIEVELQKNKSINDKYKPQTPEGELGGVKNANS